MFVSELYYDRGTHHQFTSLVRELARPGELMENTGYDFEFVQVEKPYESYTGNNVKLRYVFFYYEQDVLYVQFTVIALSNTVLKF